MVDEGITYFDNNIALVDAYGQVKLFDVLEKKKYGHHL